MKVNYSYDFSHVLQFGREEAARLGNERITSEHLLMGLLRDDKCKATKLLCTLYQDINLVELIHKTEASMPSSPTEKEAKSQSSKSSTTTFGFEWFKIDDSASKVLQHCVEETVYDIINAGNATITSVHLLLSLLSFPGSIATRILKEAGVNYNDIKKMSNRKMSNREEIEDSFDFDEEDADSPIDDSFNKSQRTFTAQPGIEAEKTLGTPYLDKYGVDLTAKAAQGKLDPCYGRENEITRIAQILSRKKKNNPILIGYPGVGKTAIIEGLADRIVKNNVPLCLFNKRVISLDMSSMVAGTKYRGQFEERIQGIINELENNPNVILFIDEIHTIVGAGNASGSMDAANILKPALSRGDLQCIGSTTIDEYRRTIEKDGALERRFQKVMIEPTTAEETLVILQNIRPAYEQYHRVIYTDEALKACVRLTERYITDRQFPDKAIDAMDEAGSRAHVINVAPPENITTTENSLNYVRERKNEAVAKQDYEEAAKMRDEEKSLETQLACYKEKWEDELKSSYVHIGKQIVEETVSQMSGVPVARMIDKESLRIKELKRNLLSHVINQDAAVTKLVKAIARNRIGLSDPNKPIGSFMFVGPTGVGKTLLAKALAEYMFGTQDALIRIDMSEYMEKYSTSRLLGAPPGYVGYDEGGQLTEKVRRHPYSVVLFDEIEKASKDVFNLLLQVMDEGRLTDSNGCTVDFKNTIIIITSNVGTRQVQDFSHSVGFQSATQIPVRQQQTNESLINKALNQQFSPEFLNRIDEIIIFEPLNREALDKIAQLEIDRLNKRLKLIGYSFKLDKRGRDFLVEKGYNKKYGARSLKRAIQTYLEEGLSDYLQGREARKKKTIRITHKKDCSSLSFE